MLRRLLLAAVALVVVPAGLGASGVRTVTAAAPVQALAMDGRLIAFAEGRSAQDCDRIRVWNLSTRGVARLGRTTSCEQTSTGVGIAQVAIAGSRVLWLHYAGGNIREWRVFTATTASTRPRLLRFASRDVDLPSPYVLGDGDRSARSDLLPYAVEREVIALRANGSRRFSWRAPTRVVALSALDDELAVASAGGLVTVLDGSGRPLRTQQFAGEVRAVQLTGDGVVAQVGNALELRRGAETRRFTLPRGSRLTDALGDRAFYVVGQQTRQLLLASGAQRLVAVGSHAEAEGSTAAVAGGRTVSARPLP